MLDITLVAAVLEGIEGTLGEVVDRVEDQELVVRLEVLQSQVAALRISIEKPNEAHSRCELHD
jgi:hypothetical protein